MIAEDTQPFRCAACGVAVSHINPKPCDCVPSAPQPDFSDEPPGYTISWINGVGLDSHEYGTPAAIWHDTYDADYDGEGYVGSCVCPHCRAVANHYNGPADCRPKNEAEFECIECGHYSTD